MTRISSHSNQPFVKSIRRSLPSLAMTALTLHSAIGLTALLIFGFLSPPSLADEKPDEVTVASWNVEWFFDHYDGDNRSDLAKKKTAPSRDDWKWKLDSVAAVVAEMRPTILCLQEIENEQVLYRLTQRLEDKYGLSYRIAFIQGYEFFTEQDVGIIYRSGLVEYSRKQQSREMFESETYYNLSKHLFAQFEWGAGEEKESLTIANVHLRARPEAAAFRQRQCRLLHYWLRDSIRQDANVLAVGDFNTEEVYGSETPQGEISIVRGLATDDASDDLLDANQLLPTESRVTHISGRQYDRVFYSPTLQNDDPNRQDLVIDSVLTRRDLVVRGAPDGEDHWEHYYEISPHERDLSDHYPIMVKFVFR